MTNEKGFGFTEEELAQKEKESAPRARNRTVMLTPEMTGAVRAKISQGMAQSQQPPGSYGGGDPRGAMPGRAGIPQSSPAQTPGHHQPYQPSQPHEQYETPYAGPSHSSYQQPVTQPAELFSEKLTRYQRLSPIVGFLVSYDSNANGDVFDLRSGRLIITSDATTPGSIMYVADPTVSPSHAILRITAEGEVQVLDQLSEYGTRIQKYGTQEVVELSGDKSSLEHGDVLLVGERRFFVSLIIRDIGE